MVEALHKAHELFVLMSMVQMAEKIHENGDLEAATTALAEAKPSADSEGTSAASFLQAYGRERL